MGNTGTSQEPVAVVPVGYSADQNSGVHAMIATLRVVGVVMGGFMVAHAIVSIALFRFEPVPRVSYFDYLNSALRLAELLLGILLITGALNGTRWGDSARRQMLLSAYGTLALMALRLIMGPVHGVVRDLMRGTPVALTLPWLLMQLEYLLGAIAFPILLVVLLNRPEFKEAFTCFGPPVEEDAGQGGIGGDSGR